MPYFAYKLIHLTGIFLLMLSFGALIFNQIHKTPKSPLPAMTHGIGLLLVLFGGFGLLARLGILWPLPVWAWLKLGIWVFLAAEIALIRRKPHLGKFLWWTNIALATLAGYFAIYKPFEGGP